MTNKLIFIGGDSRSGGSLLARLFDNPPQILSFPLEHEYFFNRNEHLFDLKKLLDKQGATGVLGTEYCQKLLKFADNRLKSKQFYDHDKIEIDHTELARIFTERLDSLSSEVSNELIYQTIALSFFQTLYGDYYSSRAIIVNHSSRAFLADLGTFFNAFGAAIFIHTLRDPYSYAASLKNYSFVAEGYINDEIPGNFIDFVLHRWLLSAWHALKNRQKYGDKYILTSYTNLVSSPEETMQSLCDQIGVEFSNNLLTPTMGPFGWSGNSSFGKLPSKVSSETLNKYKGTLTFREIESIKSKLKELNLNLQSIVESGSSQEMQTIEKEVAQHDLPLAGNPLEASYFRSLNKQMAEMQLKTR